MINIDDIPENPGVYLMKNDSKVIYVGKAKNLKKRVSSYFSGSFDRKKTEELVKNIKNIEYIITNTELDALILENNLIKKYRPKYNIALKDEKTYPYIYITEEKYPKIEIIRNTKYLKKNKGIYFGPYPSGALFLMKILKKVFKIRDCKRDMEKKYERPCLKYYMNICTGPCVYKNIDVEYNQQIKKLKSFLSGNEQDIIKELEKEMNVFSENMEFERAIIYREKINALKKIIESQITEYGKDIDEDVFVYKILSENIFLCVLNIRTGKIIGKNFINLKTNETFEENIFERVFIEYYEKYPIIKNIILDNNYKENAELISEMMLVTNNKKINFHFPLIKSRRKDILDMAYLNLENEINNYYQKKKNVEQALSKLKEKLYLKKMPIRIECFDISNIQGKDAVASMSVALYGKSEKKEYRKFKITIKDTPDDFLMMEEVIFRRYSKIEEKDYPDLILIDGGKGQLSSVKKILEKIKIYGKIDVISIAKREEEVFKPEETEPYILDKNSEELKILQRLRDEAHRFGITYHRLLRQKRIIKSEIMEIEGIGEKRGKELLKKFKSVKEIYNASLEELQEIVPEKTAIKIKERGRKN